MMTRFQAIQFLGSLLVFPLKADSGSVRQKLQAIENGAVPIGQVVRFGRTELLDYAREEMREKKVDGIRRPEIEFGTNRATGRALVDFHKLREQAEGHPPGMMSRILLSGERELEVSVRLTSQDGWARIDILSVEVDGWDISGRALDWLIANYLRPRYPQAKINTWFELQNNVKRLELSQAELRVLIA